MERRGGCCIARRFGGGGGDAAEAAWKMDRIMLRFRPIAPKPAAEGGGAAAVVMETAAAAPRRGKKRGGGGGGRRRRTRRRKENVWNHTSSSSSADGSPPSLTGAAGLSGIVTLPLMPETPERKEELKAVVGEGEAEWEGVAPIWAPRAVRAAGSWVTVECVTETWREGEVGGLLGFGTSEMEGDGCPGFVSDEWDRVTWTNEAYRRMVVGTGRKEDDGGDGDDKEEVRVALVTRGLVPTAGSCQAFTCRVRVRYACRKGKGSLAAPCDVWRLPDEGGLAWRLDVKAALTLSCSTTR